MGVDLGIVIIATKLVSYNLSILSKILQSFRAFQQFCKKKK